PHSLRHAAITNALDAGVPLRDAQILARHADPRTIEHYDRARGNLDRHGVHFLTAYVAGVWTAWYRQRRFRPRMTRRRGGARLSFRDEHQPERWWLLRESVDRHLLYRVGQDACSDVSLSDVGSLGRTV